MPHLWVVDEGNGGGGGAGTIQGTQHTVFFELFTQSDFHYFPSELATSRPYVCLLVAQGQRLGVSMQRSKLSQSTHLLAAHPHPDAHHLNQPHHASHEQSTVVLAACPQPR